MKSHILYVTCVYSDACLSSTFHATIMPYQFMVNRVITAAQALYH